MRTNWSMHYVRFWQDSSGSHLEKWYRLYLLNLHTGTQRQQIFLVVLNVDCVDYLSNIVVSPNLKHPEFHCLFLEKLWTPPPPPPILCKIPPPLNISRICKFRQVNPPVFCHLWCQKHTSKPVTVCEILIGVSFREFYRSRLANFTGLG